MMASKVMNYYFNPIYMGKLSQKSFQNRKIVIKSRLVNYKGEC